MSEPHVSREEVEALLETRRELGADYEAALVESFAQRVEKAVAANAEELTRSRRSVSRAEREGRLRQFVLGIVSLGVGVPVTVVPVVGTDGDPMALPVVALGWLGIVGVNVAHSRSLRATRRTPPG